MKRSSKSVSPQFQKVILAVVEPLLAVSLAKYVGQPYGWPGVCIAFIVFMVLFQRCVSFAVMKIQEKEIAEQARRFEGVRYTIHAAYPYGDESGLFTPAKDEKLVAVDITWRGAMGEIDFESINIVDPEAVGPKDDEFYGNASALCAYLDPKTGQPLDEVPAPLPAAVRLLHVFTVKSAMKTFRLQIFGYEITPEYVWIASYPPRKAAQLTAEHFSPHSAVRESDGKAMSPAH